MVHPNCPKLVVLAGAGLALLCTPSAVVAHGQWPGGRNEDGYYSAPGASYVDISMPVPIRGTDIGRWRWMMQLSETLADLFDQLYDQYLARGNEIHGKYVQPLWDRSAEISSRRSGAMDVAVAQEFADLLKTARPRALQRLVNTEEHLFNEFAAHLSESQLAVLDRIRQQRRRMRSNSRSARYPGGDIDVTMLLYALHKRGFDTMPTDPAVLDGLLAEYDAAVTPLFERRQKAIVRISGEGTVLLAVRLSMGTVREGSERWMVANELRVKSKQLNRRLVKLEKRIHSINARVVDAVARTLPDTTGRELARRFRQLVYEPVYPDPTDVTHLFEAAIAIEPLSSEQRADLEANKNVYVANQLSLCQRMKDRYLDWREFHGIEWGLPPGTLSAYERDMHKLQEARVENAELAMGLLTAILDPEQFRELEEAVSWFQTKLRNHKFFVDRRLGR